MPNVNTVRFAGFAELYDSVRPQPPHKVVEIVGQMPGKKHVEAVADIGIALSQGQVQDVLKHSPGELQSEIQILKDATAKSTAAEMRVGYTLHFGVKKSRAST